ncbi:MAG: hypothetical protein LBT26_06790 [Clostridiales Family XIII bacterium]|jgi:hypothetical protein|nr:hypothetical protein [Clostridiales Family XIII bacterium]
MTARTSKGTLAAAAAVAVALVLILGTFPAAVFGDDGAPPSQRVETGGILYYNATGSQVSDEDEAWVAVSKSIEDRASQMESVGSSDLAENEFKITLDVKTKEAVENQTISEDAAVVIVFDVSGSMGWNSAGLGLVYAL